MIVNILAQEIGYNASNKVYRTLLIDRPILAPSARPQTKTSLSNRSPLKQTRKIKPTRPLRNHDDCSKYLESISQDLTTDLELDAKRLQSKYMILSHYLDDAADRIMSLADQYIPKYEALADDGLSICDSVRRAIRLSVENYILYLLHGKLIAAIYNLNEKNDRTLLNNLNQIKKSGLTICQLGAQTAFSHFGLSESTIEELKILPTLQSPLAIVSSLVKAVGLISEDLSQGVRFKHLMDCEDPRAGQVSICSDDLIASFVYSMSRAESPHLYSLSKYLETFGQSSYAEDQTAYYMATFQIVIQYVFNYTSGYTTTNRTLRPDGQNKMIEAGQSEDQVSDDKTSDGSQLIDSLDS